MRSCTPIVVEESNLADLLGHLLNERNAPSTLVVCSSRAEFILALQSSSIQGPKERLECGLMSGAEPVEDAPSASTSLLLSYSPLSLRHLAASQAWTLAICSSVPQLRAYLATFQLSYPNSSSARTEQSSTEGSHKKIVILNLLRLHRPTSAFSAQGIQRTLSNAVEASHRSGYQLILAEFPPTEHSAASEHFESVSQLPATVEPFSNPWNEEISMLNVTTKSFGVSERGWVGRTVRIRQIAARWCTFQPHLPV